MVGMDFWLAVLIVGICRVRGSFIGGFFSPSSSRAVEESFMIGIVGVSLLIRE